MTRTSNNRYIADHVTDVIHNHSSSMYKFRLVNFIYKLDVVAYSHVVDMQNRLYWDNILGILDTI